MGGPKGKATENHSGKARITQGKVWKGYNGCMGEETGGLSESDTEAKKRIGEDWGILRQKVKRRTCRRVQGGSSHLQGLPEA